MIKKVSFYGYFFTHRFDRITTYEILWKHPHQLLLKSLTLDINYSNPADEFVVMVYDVLHNCLAGIIGRLRNNEIEQGLYRPLQPVDKLPDLYEPLIMELENSILKNNINCFSIFGSPQKYKTQTAANKLLNDMGYFVLNTRSPHLYVLEDYIRLEMDLIENRPYA
jgi:hypothetical protein